MRDGKIDLRISRAPFERLGIPGLLAPASPRNLMNQRTASTLNPQPARYLRLPIDTPPTRTKSNSSTASTVHKAEVPRVS